MHALATTAFHLPGLEAGPLELMVAAGALAAGLLMLHQGLTPLAPILGPRLHRMIGGAVLGLFAAWLTVTALWLMVPTGA